MFKRVFIFSLLAAFAVSLAGCATRGTVRQKDTEIQGLKNQVSVLETQIQSKDQELNSLKDSLNAIQAEQLRQEAAAKESVTAKVRSLPKVKDFQIALKNAGYDPGKIDGRLGKQTRQALKAFQKANNLTVNGKANKRTWALLSEYLNKQAK